MLGRKKIHETLWVKLRNYSMTFTKTLSKNITQLKTIQFIRHI